MNACVYGMGLGRKRSGVSMPLYAYGVSHHIVVTLSANILYISSASALFDSCISPSPPLSCSKDWRVKVERRRLKKTQIHRSVIGPVQTDEHTLEWFLSLLSLRPTTSTSDNRRHSTCARIHLRHSHSFASFKDTGKHEEAATEHCDRATATATDSVPSPPNNGPSTFLPITPPFFSLLTDNPPHHIHIYIRIGSLHPSISSHHPYITVDTSTPQ